jgi:phage-related protein
MAGARVRHAEIVEDHAGDTCRAIYTVKLADAVYVLHAFEKNARRGIATPKREIELIETRLAIAERHHRERRQERGRS